MAEESALRSDRDSSPDLGEMWKYGCSRSLVWSDDGFEEERSEEYCERNVDNLAIEVECQNWPSEVVSLFLEDWEVCRVATCQWTFLCHEGCELRVSGFSSCSSVELSQQQSFFLTVDRLVRGMEEKERERRVSFDLVFDVVCLWNEGESHSKSKGEKGASQSSQMKSDGRRSVSETPSELTALLTRASRGSTGVCDALTCCDILAVPLSVWSSRVSGTRA